MMNIIHQNEFKSCGEHDKKTQIILTHTSRGASNYITSLKHRLNGNYNKIPNYIVKKNGEIIQLLKNSEYSNIIDNPNVNKQSIVVCLENLGWLEKEPLKKYHVNWIGDIYYGNVFDKKWRDYFFWDPYTKIQTEKTFELCMMILNKESIKPQFVGHNTKINGIEKYEGIVSRSNFDTKYTDINPSFNFEFFLNEMEHEK